MNQALAGLLAQELGRGHELLSDALAASRSLYGGPAGRVPEVPFDFVYGYGLSVGRYASAALSATALLPLEMQESQLSVVGQLRVHRLHMLRSVPECEPSFRHLRACLGLTCALQRSFWSWGILDSNISEGALARLAAAGGLVECSTRVDQPGLDGFAT